MAMFEYGNTINAMRVRRQWQQYKLAQTRPKGASSMAFETVSRIENHRRQPDTKTMRKLLSTLELPEQFIFPYLENTSSVAFTLREALLDALDTAENEFRELNTAEELFAQICPKISIHSVINRQFIISCQARLYRMQSKAAKELYPLINEGMRLTYPEFNMQSFKYKLLLYEEASLLHTLALTLAGDGKPDDAIEVLHKLKQGLEDMPEDNRKKELKLPQVIMTLCKLLINKQDYENALNMCELGRDTSIKRNKGRLTPCFLYNKALCLFHMKSPDECPSLLRQAYFGFALMGMKDHANDVLANSRAIFGIDINTYGTENLQPIVATPPKKHGSAEACENIGDLMRQFREEAGVSAKTIYQGICTPSAYTRIEYGAIERPDIYVIEALMQRLGRDPDKYYNMFLIKNEFDDKQTRDEIMSLLVARKYDEAEKLLESIKDTKAFKKNVGKQFVLSVEASIYRSRQGYIPEYEEMLLKALKTTLPNFDERWIAGYHLTHREITIIMQLANYHAEKKAKELDRSIKIYERLRTSMNKIYVDGNEMIRTYGTLLYNYSKYLGLAGQYQKALEIVNEGELLCFSYGRVRQLPGFAINRAYDLLHLGKKEESIPYFAMAYYGSALIGRTGNQNVTGKFAEERLNIIFD
ncbi:MAG: hypothetical protein FWB91_00640 [Defluviitaleaceae bacterium]|nr:hypothetical protein [Defluviitaleaceae bacterium]